jgi:O-antigen/teichoic acid export membrane protein
VILVLKSRFSGKNPFFYGLFLTLQTYISSVLGILASIVIARSLIPAERGDLAVMIVFPQLVTRLASLGFEQEILLTKSFTNISHFLTAAMMNYVIIVIFYVGLLFQLRFDPLQILVMSISVPFILVLRILVANAINTKSHAINLTANLFQAVLQLILTFFVSIKIPGKNNFLLAWLLTISVVTGIVFVLARIPFQKLNVLQYRAVNNNSVKHLGISLGEIGYLFGIELLFMREILGSKQVGLYSIAKTLGTAYYQMFWVFSAVFSKRNLSRKSLIYVSMFLISFGLFGYFFAEYAIVLLFGNSYQSSKEYLGWTLASAGALGISRLFYKNNAIQSSSVLDSIKMAAIFVCVIVVPFVLSVAFAKDLYVPLISISYIIFAFVTIRLSQSRKNI